MQNNFVAIYISKSFYPNLGGLLGVCFVVGGSKVTLFLKLGRIMLET